MAAAPADHLVDALMEHVRARRAHRHRTTELLDAAARHGPPRTVGGAVKDLRHTYTALRKEQGRRPEFDPGPFVELVTGPLGTDRQGAERDLYRAVRQLEFLAGIRRASEDTDGGPPLVDEQLVQAAELLVGRLLEPVDGPLHDRLRATQALWTVVECGELLVLRSGPSMLAPLRGMARMERREAFMRLPEGRRDLMREWHLVLTG